MSIYSLVLVMGHENRSSHFKRWQSGCFPRLFSTIVDLGQHIIHIMHTTITTITTTIIISSRRSIHHPSSIICRVNKVPDLAVFFPGMQKNCSPLRFVRNYSSPNSNGSSSFSPCKSWILVYPINFLVISILMKCTNVPNMWISWFKMLEIPTNLDGRIPWNSPIFPGWDRKNPKSYEIPTLHGEMFLWNPIKMVKSLWNPPWKTEKKTTIPLWPDIFSRHRQHDAPEATAGGRHGGAQIGLDVQHLRWNGEMSSGKSGKIDENPMEKSMKSWIVSLEKKYVWKVVFLEKTSGEWLKWNVYNGILSGYRLLLCWMKFYIKRKIGKQLVTVVKGEWTIHPETMTVLMWG